MTEPAEGRRRGGRSLRRAGGGAEGRRRQDGRGGVEAGGWPAEGISRHVTSVGPVRLEVPVPSARHSGLRLFLRDLKGLLEYAFCGPGPTRQL